MVNQGSQFDISRTIEIDVLSSLVLKYHSKKILTTSKFFDFNNLTSLNNLIFVVPFKEKKNDNFNNVRTNRNKKGIMNKKNYEYEFYFNNKRM